MIDIVSGLFLFCTLEISVVDILLLLLLFFTKLLMIIVQSNVAIKLLRIPIIKESNIFILLRTKKGFKRVMQ